jgi:hypothetical protein
MTPAERTLDRIAKNRSIDAKLAERLKAPAPKSFRDIKIEIGTNGDVTFEQAQVFPVIAGIISRMGPGFVSHRQIVNEMLRDTEISWLLDQIQGREGANNREWWASNMMAWFSQSITVGRNPYGDQLERRSGDGVWEYSNKITCPLT